MKPYYERDGIVIYHGDCREILPEIAPLAASCVVTDPPYNETSLEWDRWPDGWLAAVAAAVTREVREHVRQLEEMLPDDLRVCFSCKEGGASPEGYVVAAAQTVRDEDGNPWCEECADSFEPGGDDPAPTAGSEEVAAPPSDRSAACGGVYEDLGHGDCADVLEPGATCACWCHEAAGSEEAGS